jgi:hypothetical protein
LNTNYNAQLRKNNAKFAKNLFPYRQLSNIKIFAGLSKNVVSVAMILMKINVEKAANNAINQNVRLLSINQIAYSNKF